jgi:NAD(P)-dependent dehydrogenase (short-subunit alcohol dehydrogenase family)
MKLEGSVVAITGASLGIGKATAQVLAAKGAKVALLARSVEIISNLAEKIPGSLAVKCDVTDFEDFRKALETVHSHYGRVDALVNNAGKAYDTTVETIDLDLLQDQYRLNILAPIVGMQVVIPWMRAQGEGSIVNISSGVSFMAVPGYAPYSSSKRALNGISLTARAELAVDNIQVSLVHPFITATDFGKNKVTTPNSRTAGADYAAGDPPENVANLIAQAIEEGGPEYFANDRMRDMARNNA